MRWEISKLCAMRKSVKINENENLEFKSSFNNDVIETLTAFANTKGGKVLIGINDAGEPIKNIQPGKESIQKWLNEIKQITEPSIIPDANIIEYKGINVVEFSIKEYLRNVRRYQSIR